MRAFLLLVTVCVAIAGCASRRVSDDTVNSWAQLPEERGKLPIGKVISVERIAFRVDRAATSNASAYAVNPIYGPAGFALLDSIRDSGFFYRHVFRMTDGSEKKVDLDISYKVGECIAFRSGLDAGSQWPVRALPGECG